MSITSSVSSSSNLCIADSILSGPEGYNAVPPLNFVPEQVVITLFAFHSDPESPKHFSQQEQMCSLEQ